MKLEKTDIGIIIDLDGTLSNATKRRKYVTSKPKNFDKFYKNLIHDKPNMWCLDILNKFYPTHQIILVSGRPDTYERLTKQWLNQWNIRYDELLMRKEGDYRADWIVKKEIYNNHIADQIRIEFAIDDRQQVVDMWRRNGIVCLQCDDGKF